MCAPFSIQHQPKIKNFHTLSLLHTFELGDQWACRELCVIKESVVFEKIVSSSNEILGFNISCFKLYDLCICMYMYVCVCNIYIYIHKYVCLIPTRGSNLCPLQWKHGFLTFVPPCKSHHLYWLFWRTQIADWLILK